MAKGTKQTETEEPTEETPAEGPEQRRGNSAATLEEALTMQDEQARAANEEAAAESGEAKAEAEAEAEAAIAEAGAAQEARDDEVYGREPGAEDRRIGAETGEPESEDAEV